MTLCFCEHYCEYYSKSLSLKSPGIKLEPDCFSSNNYDKIEQLSSCGHVFHTIQTMQVILVCYGKNDNICKLMSKNEIHLKSVQTCCFSFPNMQIPCCLRHCASCVFKTPHWHLGYSKSPRKVSYLGHLLPLCLLS